MPTIAEQLFEEGYQEGFKQGYELVLQMVRQEKLIAIETGLEIKFGQAGLREFKEISKIEDMKALYKIREALKQIKTLDELRQVYRSR